MTIATFTSAIALLLATRGRKKNTRRTSKHHYTNLPSGVATRGGLSRQRTQEMHNISYIISPLVLGGNVKCIIILSVSSPIQVTKTFENTYNWIMWRSFEQLTSGTKLQGDQSATEVHQLFPLLSEPQTPNSSQHTCSMV